MKKVLLLLIGCLCAVAANAEPSKSIIFIKQLSNKMPRSPQRESKVTGVQENDCLRIGFSEYDGVATITLMDETETDVEYTSVEPVTSPTSISIDISVLSGTIYNVYVELDNGDNYVATIQI